MYLPVPTYRLTENSPKSCLPFVRLFNLINLHVKDVHLQAAVERETK